MAINTQYCRSGQLLAGAWWGQNFKNLIKIFFQCFVLNSSTQQVAVGIRWCWSTLQSSWVSVLARLSYFPLALSEDGAGAGWAAGVTLSQSQEACFGGCSCTHLFHLQHRGSAGRRSRAVAAVGMALLPPELMWAKCGQRDHVVGCFLGQGQFLDKNGQWMPGRKGLHLLTSGRTWSELRSELELAVCQVCGLEHGTEEALMVSCSPAHYVTVLSGDTRWKEACKFRTEKSRIWVVIPLTELC